MTISHGATRLSLDRKQYANRVRAMVSVNSVIPVLPMAMTCLDKLKTNSKEVTRKTPMSGK